MIYNPRDIERIARDITLKLEDEIVNAGIFYRIFFRCKNNKSLNKKLMNLGENGTEKYNSEGKLLRDIIGIRINLYFAEDLELLTNFIKEKYKHSFVEETIDQNNTTEFKPTRINLIYRIPEEYSTEFREVVKDQRIDSTYELQLRTIFSEGWHEVEHDLRYKCKDDWHDYPELSRTFNGILASLETHEWSIIQLFERLSYSHYKAGKIRTKLRIRFEDLIITKRLSSLLESDDSFKKDFFKLDRNTIVFFLLKNKLHFPTTLENIIYLINHFFIRNKAVSEITPEVLIENFKRLK
jgi:putative GTP pyrophosphokinase